MLRHKEASDNRGGRLQLGARGVGPGKRRVRFLRLQEAPPSTPPRWKKWMSVAGLRFRAWGRRILGHFFMKSLKIIFINCAPQCMHAWRSEDNVYS